MSRGWKLKTSWRATIGSVAIQAKAVRLFILIKSVFASPMYWLATSLALLAMTGLVSTAYAEFGISCTPPPKADSTGYLTSDTAYGYLLSNIDMTTNITDGCAQGDNVLRFCLKNSNPIPVCTPIQLNVGDATTLSSIRDRKSVV